ncbi:hypothetical protein [Scytonema millei]|nr:hypothetical protein [Scytonema millei]
MHFLAARVNSYILGNGNKSGLEQIAQQLGLEIDAVRQIASSAEA